MMPPPIPPANGGAILPPIPPVNGEVGGSYVREEDAELARQLLALRQAPGPALQQRVRAIPRPSRQRTARSGPKLAWALSGLVFVLLLMASPAARATLNEMKKVIGHMPLIIRDAWTGEEATKVVEVESRELSLTEAQATLPFAIAAPAYLPESLTGDSSTVSVLEWDVPVVKMEWRHARGGVVQLSMQPAGPDNVLTETVVGPDSSQPVLVNGREAVVVQGGWNQASGDWGHEDEVMTLIWQAEGVRYRLLAAGTDLPLNELISIAESIP